jgi:hypothetical protein
MNIITIMNLLKIKFQRLITYLYDVLDINQLNWIYNI